MLLDFQVSVSGLVFSANLPLFSILQFLPLSLLYLLSLSPSLYLWSNLSVLWLYTFCVRLWFLLVADSLFQMILLYICRGKHSPFQTPCNPQAAHKHTDRQVSSQPLKDVIKFSTYLTSAFYTSMAELVIPMQIYLGPSMDTHTQFTTIHMYTPIYIYIYIYIYTYTHTHTHIDVLT